MPYNVKASGHVSGGDHREFAMASGEMSKAEFLSFNKAGIGTALPQICDGGPLGTYIDWRGLTIVHGAATALKLAQINLIVWAKTNGGIGGGYALFGALIPFGFGSISSVQVNLNNFRGRADRRFFTFEPSLLKRTKRYLCYKRFTFQATLYCGSN